MIRSILFPTDFSAVANSAFPLAVAIAAQFDATIYSLHVSQGGDPHVVDEYDRLPHVANRHIVAASRAGYVTTLDAERMLGDKYQRYSSHDLRPGNLLVLYVRKDALR